MTKPIKIKTFCIGTVLISLSLNIPLLVHAAFAIFNVIVIILFLIYFFKNYKGTKKIIKIVYLSTFLISNFFTISFIVLLLFSLILVAHGDIKIDELTKVI